MPIIYCVVWLLLVWGVGWVSWPLSRRIWQNALPDSGLAASRVLALSLWTLLAFWLGNLGVPVRFCALLIFPLLLVGIFFLWRERRVLANVLREKKRAVVAGEVLFLGVFLFFLVLRGFGPGTADGEKPMDMAIIAASARADYLPPPNPYAAGLRLTAYYYFGHLQTALLTNATFSSPQWTYNLMCATVPALVFSTLLSLCSALTRRLSWGLFATAAVLCLGTLGPLRQFFPGIFGDHADGTGYFSTSRVIPFTINEYPFFTFAFGDLHAHLFAMPLAVTVLSLAWALWVSKQRITLLALGAMLGALAMTNTWDFPLYLLLGLIVIWRRHALLGQRLKACAMLVFTALLVASVFLVKLKSSSSGVHFIAPSSPIVAWLMVYGVCISALLLGIRYREPGAETSFCLMAAACGILALIWSEVTWMGYLSEPYHRQDTVFKFGLQAMLFCGVAAACLAIPQVAERRWPRFLPLLFVPFLLVMLWSSILTAWGRAGGFAEFKGLSAWEHLPPNAQTAAAWLQERAREDDHILEAEKYDGGDYTEYSRYANATGIPVVVGPSAHTFQWLGSWEDTLARKKDVRTFYTTDDHALRLAILRKYNVRWVICGELERREYGAAFVARVAKSLPVAAQVGEAFGEDIVVICENPLAS